MSLILDALNRADRERSVENKSPTLQTSQSADVKNTPPLKRWMIEALIILAVLAVAYYFFNGHQSEKTMTTSTVETSEKHISEVPKHDEPKKITKPITALAEPAALEPKASLSEPVSEPAIDQSSIEALYAQSNSTTLSVPNEEVTNANKVIGEQPKPIPKTPSDTQSILASIPLLSQQSLSFQRLIPSIEYSIHAYAEQGGFVVLNGEKYRTGGRLSSQLRVIAILKDSIVLDFNGKQFRLIALNSWINI